MKRILLQSVVLLSGLAVAGGAFDAKFNRGLPEWEIVSYQDRVAVSGRLFRGRPSLVVTRVQDPGKLKAKSSSWEARSGEIDVTPGRAFILGVRATGTVPMRGTAGCNGSYRTCVRWYGADGRELPWVWPFGFETATNAWRESLHCGTVPDAAVRARIVLGDGGPHLGTNDFLAVSRLVFAQVEDAPRAVRATLRDDGTLLRNGEPFFPIGIYAVQGCAANSNSMENAIRSLKDVGFNFILRGGDPKVDFDGFLELADRYGMITACEENPPDRFDMIVSGAMARYRRHPSLVAWYLADDSTWTATPEQVLWRRRLCRAFDPEHLTLQADRPIHDGGQARYTPYVGTSEIFLPEVYPCRTEKPTGTEIADFVRMMRTIPEAIAAGGRPTRSIWPILQQFDGWGWKRFPTFEEVRAECWQSVIHGGRGVVWYVYTSRSGRGRGVVSSPEQWNTMTRVVRELALVRADLVERDAEVQPKVEVLSGPAVDVFGNASVSALLKEGARPLLMAANATTNAVTARIGVAGFRRAKEIFEGRTVDAAIRGLKDGFAPLAVHVYRLEK